METIYEVLLIQVTVFLIHHSKFGSAGIATGDPLYTTSSTGKPMHCQHDLLSKTVSCRERNLESVPDHLFNDMIVLDLSRNSINYVHTFSFRRYLYLEDLNLSYNDITFIATAAFSRLKRLKVLRISGNYKLNNIPIAIFEGCVNLLQLHLEHCNITTLPHDTFRWLPKLQNLFLGENPIDSINISICPKQKIELIDLTNTLFENITHETFLVPCMCNKLKLLFIGLRAVDPDVIASLRVKDLFIGVKENSYGIFNLSQVYRDVFRGIARSSVECLTITHFDIRANSTLIELANKTLTKFEFLELEHDHYVDDFYQSIFGGLSHVRMLDIFNSSIRTIITLDFFAGMDTIIDLDLSYNDLLNFVMDGVSFHLSSLLSLNLSFNSLIVITCDSRYDLNNLVSLDLSGNRILNMFSIWHLTLQYLNVSHTEIVACTELHVPKLNVFSFYENLGDPYLAGSFFDDIARFSQTPSLKVLNLSKSLLKFNYLYDLHTKLSLFEGLETLTFLDLHGNGIGTLMDGMFPKLSFLEELILRQCQIRTVYANVFDDLSSLSILDLSDNNIIRLPASVLSSPTRLRYFFIEGNILTHLEEQLFLTTSNLTKLRINRNQFATLNISTFASIMSSIISIDMSENPLECSCDLKWLVEWLRASEDFLQAEGTCSPALKNSLRGKPLTSVDLSVLCNEHTSLLIIAAPCIVLVLLIIITMTFHSRWLLKYKLFLVKLSILGFREIEDNLARDNFQFDLNIMFTGDNKVWATQYLKGNLEEQIPQFKRVAFGDDDLPLSMWKLDAVHFLIERSFKTVLLVSKAALQDEDFMLKLRIALNHMTNKNIQSTILIFLENIPDEEMPYLVKSYLSEHMFYIEWVESPEGQRFFWKQLIKRLKVDVKRNDVEPRE